jgi:hypothetical protein
VHAQKAKELLDQFNQELKLAAEEANKNKENSLNQKGTVMAWKKNNVLLPGARS